MNRGNKGFTLVELLLVILILAILTGISIPIYRVINARTRESATETEMINIVKALEMHHVDFQSYPLAAVYPGSLEDNDYMEDVPLLDTWDNAYQYTSNGLTYSLKSYGIDGVNGGNDDILITDGVMTSEGAY
jgi:general secretion pathway protein G